MTSMLHAKDLPKYLSAEQVDRTTNWQLADTTLFEL